MNLENSYTPAYTDLIEMLRYNAEITPDSTVFTFLIDGETEEESLTYKELDDQVRLIAHTAENTWIRWTGTPALSSWAGLYTRLVCLFLCGIGSGTHLSTRYQQA